MRFQSYINENSYIKPQALHLNKLMKKCAPYLKTINRGLHSRGPGVAFLFSGRNDVNEKGFQIKKVRKRRKPRDTSNDVSQYFDNAFKDKFGWRGRTNAVFCTGLYKDAQQYGKVYMIFPIGEYKFIWSPKIKDLYEYKFTIDIGLVKSHVISISDIRHLSEDGMYFDLNVESITMVQLTREYEKNRKKLKNISKFDYINDNIESRIEENKKIILEKVLKGLDKAVNTYTNKNLPKAIRYQNEIMINCEKYYAVYIGDRLENMIFIYNYFLKYGIKKQATKERADKVWEDASKQIIYK